MKRNIHILVLTLVIVLLGAVPALAAPPNPGDLIINEVMQNPSSVTDAYGEWFEVYNASSVTVDLDNCVVSDDGSDSFTIATGTSVAPGQYFLFCNDGDLADNGGMICDYSWAPYTQMYLGNSGDEIIITCDSTEIDRIEYDGGPNWPDPSGAAMQYSVPNTGDTSNNVASNWSAPTTSQYVTGDYGTPGAKNDDWMGPNAITLSAFAANTAAPALLIGSVLLLGAVILWRRKRA